MAIDEKLVRKHMDLLGISREDAIQLIEDDRKIDKGEKLFELSKEQEKAAKEARQVSRKPTVYKFDTTKRKRAENVGKRDLIEVIRKALEDAGCTSIDVTNIEREICFQSADVRYKVVLSAPRK